MIINSQVLQKRKENFLLQGSSEKTRQTYRTALKRFNGFAGKEDRLTVLNQEDLRALLLYLHKDYKLQGTSTSINTYNGLCKFFLKVVLNPSRQKERGPQCTNTLNFAET